MRVILKGEALKSLFYNPKLRVYKKIQSKRSGFLLYVQVTSDYRLTMSDCNFSAISLNSSDDSFSLGLENSMSDSF